VGDVAWSSVRDKIANKVHNTCTECCFQIQRDTGLWYSAEYSSFSLSSEADFYRLSVSGYSGDAGDALAAAVNPLRIVNGMRFTTSDQDNDQKSSGVCMNGNTGWWFKFCARSTLNYWSNGIWNADTDDNIRDVVFARMLVKLA